MPLYNLLHLTGLRRVLTSDSNAAFTGVSVKVAVTVYFVVRVPLGTAAFERPDINWTYSMLSSS
jgi:hypothetical protein